MDQSVPFDDITVCNRLCRSVTKANVHGWRTFQNEVYGQLDQQLREFVQELILDPPVLRTHRVMCEESLALLVASFMPLTQIDYVAIKSVREQFFFDRKERSQVLAEGFDLCQQQLPKFYQGYRDWVIMLTGGEEIPAGKALLELSWLVVLVMRKCYDLDPTLARCNQFE